MILATDAFDELAREAASGMGLLGLRIATLRHPIGGIGEGELRKRADRVVDQIVAQLRA